MVESGYFNNGNFREYSYFAGGGFCSLETGIPGGPVVNIYLISRPFDWFAPPQKCQIRHCINKHNNTYNKTKQNKSWSWRD